MKEEVTVEILHHILDQISSNVSGDCCRIIEKLFDSVQFTETVSISKTLCSIKLLLKLYEKLQLRDGKAKSTLPVGKIFQRMKHLFGQIYSDKCAQTDMLSIISMLCKIRLTCDIPDFGELLRTFYDDILGEIFLISSQKDHDSGHVSLLLRILCALYGLQFSEGDALKTYTEKAKCSLFAQLALCGDENVATLTSLFLLPEFVRFFKTDAPMRCIWGEISKRDSHDYSRIFLILCNFLSVNLLVEKTNLVEFLVGQVNYWELVQYGLLNRNLTMRKQAMYVFKKTIDVLSKRASDECSTMENVNRYWNPNRTEELIKIYSDIIIILEYLNEEQVHIVRPIFQLIERVVDKIIQCDFASFSWIFLIYEIVLMHESTEVNKWGIKSLLKVSRSVLWDEEAVKETAILLITNLNDINLYYNEGLEVTEALSGFFVDVSRLETAPLFFKTFIRELCQQVWSPEALFFVSRSFSKLRELSFWALEDIDEIRLFVAKAFRTHNKTIRNGIQCEILNAVLALTNHRKVPLESLMLLFSKFNSEIFRGGIGTRDNVVSYLRRGYSEDDAETILNLFLNSSQYDEQCASLSVDLFHHAFGDDLASKTFLNLLSPFKNSQQRPYCDASTLNRNLLIISEIIGAYIQRNEHPKLLPLVSPFYEDLIFYTHSRMRTLSSLKDFTTCKSCLTAFETLIKLRNLSESESLFERLLESLESDLCREEELSSVQKYFGMRLVKVIYESCKLEPIHLDKHILQNVNTPLRREESTKDSNLIWGKINSEFFEVKWMILEYFIRIGKIRLSDDETEVCCIRNEDLLKMCVEGLDVGRYGVVCPIMSILSLILPQINETAELERVVNLLWNITLERRKTDEFKFCVESFVAMLFQEKLFSKRDVMQILTKYMDLIFSDSSLVTVHALMTHAEKLEITDNSMPILCQILGKGLVFGPVQKKDERLTAQVCSYVQSFWNFPISLTSSKIRGRAAVKLLRIRNEKGVSKKMVDTLMHLESEISKNRTRYYSNSFVHRTKTRVMQALLVLLDSCEKEEKKKIAEWVYISLMTENPQTSVRNLQELTLSLLYKFCYSSFNFFGDEMKKTQKGWCSLMTIAYLLAKASLCDIDDAIHEILPFCMDQHFEARLYAEVVIVKLYHLAEERGLRELVEKWRIVHECIKKSICRAEGNAAKNYSKLEKHFFFNGFNLRTHYSLETIYYELPRLTNMASDEWIPSEFFSGVSMSGSFDLGLNALNKNQVLQRMSNTEWVTEKTEELPTGDEVVGVEWENYQKKMIPIKPLTPGCSELDEVADSLEEDGLVVVASLIDRTPNLGGLARTCEVFGASQLVLNTTKCMEDKDFKSVSVTAEKWIRVKEVKTESLLNYIVEMKEKGFRVMGAEQAVHSEPLTRTQFPRRCVLLLGNEKKGIPPNLLPLLDVCVEIPQAGIIRSLNVHVSGALFVWEYAKQNLFVTGKE